ncbi:Methyltransferase domain-containing protein [Rhizobiales bacterium GAS188]|nr:Methyltransferase domain-containing protein [Rhizobiales bacterium GAS188]
MANKEYLLNNAASELERLRLQARVWEPESEAWLDQIGIASGWRCLDLGCGAMGILGPLAKRVGEAGSVVGLDRDAQQLAAARSFVEQNKLDNVEIIEDDAYASSLPDAAFDLVHVRFVFAPAGRDEALLSELHRLVKPGGIVAIQEPDSASWSCYPPHPAWTRLKDAILAAFRAGGGDFDAGRRTLAMLRRRGLEEVRLRAAVVALQDRHPYLRLPIQFATSLRARIVAGGLMSEDELDLAIAECERLCGDAATSGTSFVVTQVFGRKPA